MCYVLNFAISHFVVNTSTACFFIMKGKIVRANLCNYFYPFMACNFDDPMVKKSVFFDYIEKLIQIETEWLNVIDFILNRMSSQIYSCDCNQFSYFKSQNWI